eukprot:scaffold21930_cov20-Tisochrysis_lutea.AAC.1
MYPFHHSVPFNFVNATIRLLLYPVFTEGGKQLCADLEALANECARICNRARSRLEGGSNDLWKGDHQEVKQDCNKQAFLGQETLWQEKRESTAKSESSDFDSSAGFLVEGTPPVGILKEAVFALCMPTGLQQEELDSTLAELGPIFSERLDPSGSLGQQLSDVWGTDEECVRALEQLEQRAASCQRVCAHQLPVSRQPEASTGVPGEVVGSCASGAAAAEHGRARPQAVATAA